MMSEEEETTITTMEERAIKKLTNKNVEEEEGEGTWNMREEGEGQENWNGFKDREGVAQIFPNHSYNLTLLGQIKTLAKALSFLELDFLFFSFVRNLLIWHANNVLISFFLVYEMRKRKMETLVYFVNESLAWSSGTIRSDEAHIDHLSVLIEQS